MPPTITKMRSRPPHHTPHSPPYTLLIIQLLDKSKDNLIMTHTQGRNMQLYPIQQPINHCKYSCVLTECMYNTYKSYWKIVLVMNGDLLVLYVDTPTVIIRMKLIYLSYSYQTILYGQQAVSPCNKGLISDLHCYVE